MAGKKATNEEAAYAEAQMAVAKDLANIELEQIEEQSALERAKTQDEQEKLVAEAYRVTGRLEGVNFISKLGNVSTLMMLQKVKEQKIYRDMPGVGTWENYCNLTGFSRRLIDEQLLNLKELGSDFLETSFQFGLGYRELKKLRSASSEGILSIDDKTITIDIIDGDETRQEVIPLDDTEELKDALERVLENRDVKIKSMEQLQKFNEKRYADTEKELRKAQKQLNTLNTKGEIEGMPEADYKPFKDMAAVAETLTNIYKQLLDTANAELSDNNTQYLHGTIMYMVHLAGELSELVPSYGVLNTSDADLAAAEKLPIPGVRNLPGHQPGE